MEDVKVKIIQSEEFKTFFYAGDLKMLYVLILLMALDILTGTAKAIKDRRLWSRKGLFGYGRKILIFVIIVVSNVIDQILALNGGLIMITILFYIANEALSVVENCAAMGVLVPKQLAERLAVIKNEGSQPPSITTEIKEEMTTKYNKELEDNETSEINIKMKK
ncbi:phage holin family protein [Staphylococcus hominis]|uniref:phage holin family protein n=1 Tax=Staphylococcus hominis TaxID=1290 RepID=UPI001F59A70F|nr:phage holin family protein [Staphylococcus hominis]MCI2862407.1 phage holin family protein [Staphylococcus hominis]MCI2866304.1 phage holin family protein [Staphylococcus hominis]MCI2883960.1 phage holin family protein [Staphylococcus hominis]MCI2923406.1 phage holin family protein [Staphylococcus hominis]MDS3912803.1 phage holin family protein [Staphylococcus hominis]